MNIVSWNVNSVRTRLDNIVNWLKVNSIDVLCMQETKVTDDQFPTEAFKKLGYHVYASGQKSYNGVAICSLIPLSDVSTGFSPILNPDNKTPNPYSEFDQQKRIITGVINGIRIINLYVPNGSAIGSDKFTYKLEWLKILRSYLEVLQKQEPLCICGDINIVPEDRDIHTPPKKDNQWVGTTSSERQGLQNVLALGLKDAFRKFTPEGGHYTWWDYRGGGFPKNHGWRIDHFYLSESLYEQATQCIIDIKPRQEDKPSDHTPVILTLPS